MNVIKSIEVISARIVKPSEMVEGCHYMEVVDYENGGSESDILMRIGSQIFSFSRGVLVDMAIMDKEISQLRGKEFSLVKVNLEIKAISAE